MFSYSSSSLASDISEKLVQEMIFAFYENNVHACLYAQAYANLAWIFMDPPKLKLLL